MPIPLAGVLAGTPLTAAVTAGTAGLSLGAIGGDLPLVGGFFGDDSSDETIPDEYVLVAAAAVAIVLVIMVSKQ